MEGRLQDLRGERVAHRHGQQQRQGGAPPPGARAQDQADEQESPRRGQEGRAGEGRHDGVQRRHVPRSVQQMIETMVQGAESAHARALIGDRTGRG